MEAFSTPVRGSFRASHKPEITDHSPLPAGLDLLPAPHRRLCVRALLGLHLGHHMVTSAFQIRSCRTSERAISTGVLFAS